VYERQVAASLRRVWENVHDWEHLPWLHGSSFCDIALEEAGAWGWRARIALPPAEAPQWIRVELRREGEDRYHARTLEGPGAGTDIVTTLSQRGAGSTAIRVEFRVPGLPVQARGAVGRRYVSNYTRLWDEDEAMMIRRQAFLDARRQKDTAEPAPDAESQPDWEPVPLGSLHSLGTGPHLVEAHGERFRVLRIEERWVAHAVVCPHRGGPLESAQVRDGAVVCPWHGYRFDLTTGRGRDGKRCRLPHPARVVVDPASGEASLHFRR